MKLHYYLLSSVLLCGCDPTPKESPKATAQTADAAGPELENRHYQTAWMTVETQTPEKLTFDFWLSDSTLRSGGAKKQFPDGSWAAIIPVFLRHQDGSDVYSVKCKYPLDSDSRSEASKEVSFNGTMPATAHFPDQKLIVTIRPKNEREPGGPANAAPPHR